ncbi:MAG: MFS transporter [Defluviitaleaceae bacterium]|nr:MFS transporter [Defluviitaleaceae bacterium]
MKELRRDYGQLKKREPNILTFIKYGLLFDAALTLWKPFSVKFLERLGGGPLEISLLSALPGLAAAAALIPGAFVLARFADKKKATAAFILASRALLLLLAFIPALPEAARPMLFVALIAVMNMPDALSQTSLQSFLGSVFSGGSRARAIALRNKFGNAVVPVITIITGLIITYLPGNDRQRMVLYQIFFAGAFLTGLAEIFVFKRFKTDAPADGKTSEAPGPSVRLPDLAGIFRDKRFMAFFAPLMVFVFCWQTAWPICAIYQVENLRANEIWFALFALASCGGAFVAAGYWQKFIRKHGNRATLIFSASLLSINLLLYPLSINVYIMTAASFYGGFVTIGLNTAMLAGVLDATPEQKRLVYIAFYNTAMNLSLFIAPFFSLMLLNLVGGVFPLFFILAVLRMLAAGVLYFAKRGGAEAAAG